MLMKIIANNFSPLLSIKLRRSIGGLFVIMAISLCLIYSLMSNYVGSMRADTRAYLNNINFEHSDQSLVFPNEFKEKSHRGEYIIYGTSGVFFVLGCAILFGTCRRHNAA